MTCERCGHRAIVLYRTWDERGGCMACLYEGRSIAETVALSARLDRLFARTPSAEGERPPRPPRARPRRGGVGGGRGGGRGAPIRVHQPRRPWLVGWLLIARCQSPHAIPP